jgi:hypothetical protein
MEEIKMLGVDSGIYRDDGLMVTDLAPRGVEQLKKKLSALFRKEKLEINIEENKKRVEFLDIYLDLDLDEYGPFQKPGDTPVYVHSQSNHPRKVLENIPLGINRTRTDGQNTNHCLEQEKLSFRTRNPKNASGLSRYIWNLEDQNFRYELEWKIIGRARPYDPASGVGSLGPTPLYFFLEFAYVFSNCQKVSVFTNFMFLYNIKVCIDKPKVGPILLIQYRS